MMNINIAELQTDLGRELPFSFAVTAAELDALSNDYKFEDPIKVTGTVVYTGMRWRVSGKIEVVKTFVCNRCLTDCREEQVHDWTLRIWYGIPCWRPSPSVIYASPIARGFARSAGIT